MTVCSPIVKWAGGKTKLLASLRARAPATFGRYFEPFLGGGALFFRLGAARARISDANAALISCYQAVRDDVEGVIAGLERHEALHSEAHYYATRDAWNRGLEDPVVAAAAFLYLNKTCFNGLWRVNRKGAFNVPAGRYERPAIVNAVNLRAASRLLARTELEVAPFEAVLEHAEGGDFVYFDPPYHPSSETANFTSYTAEPFSATDQERLAQVFRELDDRGCWLLASNSDTRFIRRLYAGYRFERIQVARAINSQGTGRGAVGELIIRNR